MTGSVEKQEAVTHTVTLHLTASEFRLLRAIAMADIRIPNALTELNFAEVAKFLENLQGVVHA